MAADVKMCEMIAELNLPLATADSLTNILIGRELKNFHCYYYYGFVVYTCCVAHSFCCQDVVLKLEGCAHK